MKQNLSLLFLFILSNWIYTLHSKNVSCSQFQKEIKIPDSTVFDKLDEYARKAPKQYEENTKLLAEYLIIPAKSDLEKARVIYSWMATHIKYDASAFNSNKLGDQSSLSVMKKKKGVCEGYSNLMKELCGYAGLECEKVVGYSKGYGYEVGDKIKQTDHAWNVIKIEGKWKLVDATWGR